MFEQRDYEDRNLFMMRWTARIFGAASLTILLLFLFGNGFFGGYFDWTKMSGDEVIGEMLFPIVLMIGLLLSWRMELVGGTLTLAFVLTFYFLYGLVLEKSLERTWWFIFFAIPGALFLTYGIATPNRQEKIGNKLKAFKLKLK